MLGMVGSSVCCILCKGSILFFDKVGKAKFEQHMQFEHGAAFNLEFMLAACKMNEAERKALVEVFDPKRGNVSTPEISKVSGKVATSNLSEKGASHKKKSNDCEIVKSENKTEDMNVKTIVSTKEPHTPRKREPSAPKTPRKRQNSVSNDTKNEPKTPGKRQQSASRTKGKETKPPGKRDSSASNITTSTIIVTAPETPRKRTPSAATKESGTQNEEEPTASSSFGTEPKTPRKREPSASKKEPKTPTKRESKTTQQAGVFNGNPEPKTPGKVGRPKTPSKRELSANREEPKTPTKKEPPKTPEKLAPPKTPEKRAPPKTPAKSAASNTPAKAAPPKTPAKSAPPKTPAKSAPPKTTAKASQPKTPVKATQPKTPVKGAPPNTPAKATLTKTTAKKRESSISNLNTKEAKKAKQEELAHKDKTKSNLDSDSDSVIFVNDPSLTPCKICPLTFSFKREYREHLKKHKKETSAKIKNTKKEIEDLKMNLKPHKSRNQNHPEKVDFPVAIPSNVRSRTKDGKVVEKKATNEEMKRLLKKKMTTKSLTKKSPRIAAKDNRWQCGLSNGAGRCKETFDIRRGLRYHMANDHGKNRGSGC